MARESKYDSTTEAVAKDYILPFLTTQRSEVHSTPLFLETLLEVEQHSEKYPGFSWTVVKKDQDNVGIEVRGVFSSDVLDNRVNEGRACFIVPRGASEGIFESKDCPIVDSRW